MARYLNADERWQAVSARDPRARGRFFYGVRTTGVYCLANCGSRRPRRENVLFFATAEEAELKGFRACKKCKPRQPETGAIPEAVIAVCRLLEEGEGGQSLEELARKVKTSPFGLHRLFKKHLGVSPKGYASQKRSERFRTLLERKKGVTEALYQAGYGSSGRCYENAAKELGMTPGQYRQGGAGLVLSRTIVPCALGWVGIGATGKGVSLIELGDDSDSVRAAMETRLPRACWQEGAGPDQRWVEAIVARLEGGGDGRDVPLDIRGTVFQRQVWQALGQIPAGETRTYSDIAGILGKPTGARAVAKACGSNPVAVVIPCHRVVGKDGELRGYRWGLARKRQLLAREKKRAGITAANRKGSNRPR